MGKSKEERRYSPYSHPYLGQLRLVNKKVIFDWWKEQYDQDIGDLRNMTSLQLPKHESQIVPNQKQIFAVMDTCSLICNFKEFIALVTKLRLLYRGLDCPLRFVIPIEVVEEMDSKSAKRIEQMRNDRENHRNQRFDPVRAESFSSKKKPQKEQSLMRVIEEEIRVFQIILPDFDPGHMIKLPTGNLREDVMDNSILGSCRRAQLFIGSKPHHPETKVLLVTEDVNFRAKATSFQVPTFSWRDFMAKYPAFIDRNCSLTQTDQAKLNASHISGGPTQPSTRKLKPKPQHKKPRPSSSSREPVNDTHGIGLKAEAPLWTRVPGSQSALSKVLPAHETLPNNNKNGRGLGIKTNDINNNSSHLSSVTECSSQDDVCFIKEIIVVE